MYRGLIIWDLQASMDDDKKERGTRIEREKNFGHNLTIIPLWWTKTCQHLIQLSFFKWERKLDNISFIQNNQGTNMYLSKVVW